jgi:short-subunit dehydrogenase
MSPQPKLSSTPRTLVVGASSGIGRCLARQLLARGCEVIAVARRGALLEDLRASAGAARLHLRVCDTASSEEVNALSNELRSRGLPPELLILNAGIGRLEDTSETSVRGHRAVFEVNYFGPLRWVEAWLEPQVPRTFVAVSSLMAFFSSAGASAYGASKAALSSTFESLALSHAAEEQRFVLVHPGPVDTAMLKTPRPLPFTWSPERAAERILRGVFAGRPQIDFCWPYTWVAKSFRLLPARARRALLTRK